MARKAGDRAQELEGAAAMDWEMTLDRVRRAAEFCAAAGLVRFRLEEGELEVEVRRRPRQIAEIAVPEAPTTAMAVPSPNGAVAREAAPTVVKAEFVGIVRLARPAVDAGTVLSEDRELAYVESLGVRNPVRSNGPGRIVRIHVSDGQPVEYGQPLFSIDPA